MAAYPCRARIKAYVFILAFLFQITRISAMMRPVLKVALQQTDYLIRLPFGKQLLNQIT